MAKAAAIGEVRGDDKGRLCLLFSKSLDGYVTCIPCDAGEGLRVTKMLPNDKFTREWPRRMGDYPFELTCALFVRYAREFGASGEALKLLGKHTVIDPTHAEAAVKALPAESSTPRYTMADMFKDLIQQGKLKDKAIFAQVQKAFGLPDSKFHYVADYRRAMRQGGKK